MSIVDKAESDYNRYRHWAEDDVTREIIDGLKLAHNQLVDRIATTSVSDREAACIRATIAVYRAFITAPTKFLTLFANKIAKAKETSEWGKLVDPSHMNVEPETEE